MVDQEKISQVLGEDQAWPLVDVLGKLIEASEILLNVKDYDGHDWEEIHLCVSRGKEIVKLLNTHPAAE